MTARISITLIMLLAFSVVASAQHEGALLAAADRSVAESQLADARRHFENEEWERAATAYEMAKHHTSFTLHDLHDLAYALIRLSRYDRAARVLRNIIEIDAEDDLAHYNLGVIYLRTARYALAEKTFERAAWLAPSDPDAWYLLAYAAINNDDLTRAWEVLDILIVLDEEDALDVFETLVEVQREREDPTDGW